MLIYYLMSKPYGNVLNRSKVLHHSIEKLIQRNHELAQSNKKLRKACEDLQRLIALNVKVVDKEEEKEYVEKIMREYAKSIKQKD